MNKLEYFEPKSLKEASSILSRYKRETRILAGVIFGPGDPKFAHQINERVEIRNLIAAAKIYAMTAVDILK